MPLTTNFIDEARTVETLTAFNRLYLNHCWTTGALEGNVTLNAMGCRSAFGILLPFTARELIEPLQVELNCNQLFGMHCRGLVGHCILTVIALGRASSLMTHCHSRRRRRTTSLVKMRLIVLTLLASSMWRSLVLQQSALMV